MSNETLQWYIYSASLSSLIERWTWWVLHTEQQAAVYISGRLYHCLWRQIALSCLWTMCGEARLSLLYVFFSWQLPGYSSFLSEPKGKRCFIGWHSLWREVCIAGVGQFTALCNSVYVQCVCRSNKMYALYTMHGFVFIIKLCLLSCYKHTASLSTINNGNKSKKF